jgi:hypothetical protein
VQQCVDPLLYEGRKFDIRVWVLYAHNRLWFYREGYVRTSSREYSAKTSSKLVHLTNDAVQKHAEDYGKHEPGNKVSFADLDKYLRKTHDYEGFYSELLPCMRHLAKALFEAGMLVLGRTGQQFELFGLDFLLDREWGMSLIECNSNPCLETSCSLLNRLVPAMVEGVLSIAVDPFFPPPERRVVREDPGWPSDRFNFELLSDATI